MARRNATHIVRGVEAVINSANRTKNGDIWVDDGDVADALQQFKKLSDQKFPEIKVYTGNNDRDRVALKLK